MQLHVHSLSLIVYLLFITLMIRCCNPEMTAVRSKAVVLLLLTFCLLLLPLWESVIVLCYVLYVHSSIAIILMGKRELIALLNLSSWCLVMVERLFIAVPWGCLQFVIVVFPDHTHLLFLMSRLLCLCCVVTVKSFPVHAFNVVIITIVWIYT